MKKEIPLIGLVLVLALLLILPMFQITTTHAFVCNISTIFSVVEGCYIHISISGLPLGVCGCKHHQFFITENGLIGSLAVVATVSVGRTSNPYTWPCPYTYIYTTIICVLGYILVSGNLASHYVKPLSYTGYCFHGSDHRYTVFYCLSHLPKSMLYLGTLLNVYYVSCFYLVGCRCFTICTRGREVMTPIVGFRVPLDDIFYYILSPSLFCGSVKVKSPYTSIVKTCSGYWGHATCYYVCWASILWIYSTITLPYYPCFPFFPCAVHCILLCTGTILTITTLTYTICIGNKKYTGSFCLIDTFLTILPTKTMSCSLVLPPYPYLEVLGSFRDVKFTIITSSGYIYECTYIPPWCPFFILGTNIYRRGTFTTFTITVDGGVLINYLPYCTEYLIYFHLCYTTSCICC